MMKRGNGILVAYACALAFTGVGLAAETNRIESGTLTFENGAVVFTTATSTNRFPMADTNNKKIRSLPGLFVVSFDERVLMSKDGDTRDISTVHLRTITGEGFVLDEHKPLPVRLETRLSVEGGKTNDVYIWRLRKEDGTSNQPPQDIRGP